MIWLWDFSFLNINEFHLNEFHLRVSVLQLLLLTFGCFLSLDCKLARGGPPATIVAIDEESRNGEWTSRFTNDFSFPFNPRLVTCESTKGKLQPKSTNSTPLISSLYGLQLGPMLEMLYLFNIGETSPWLERLFILDHKGAFYSGSVQMSASRLGWGFSLSVGRVDYRAYKHLVT